MSQAPDPAGAAVEMVRSGEVAEDLANALSAVTSPFGRETTGYEDVPTPALHARWRAGETADYVETELQRRHPELARLDHLWQLVASVEDRSYPSPEPFDIATILDKPAPCADAALAQYYAVRDVIVEYEDSYLDGPALARRLGIKPGTVRKMQQRGVLPRPDLVIAGRPAWHWLTVRAIEQHRRGPGRPPSE